MANVCTIVRIGSGVFRRARCRANRKAISLIIIEKRSRSPRATELASGALPRNALRELLSHGISFLGHVYSSARKKRFSRDTAIDKRAQTNAGQRCELFRFACFSDVVRNWQLRVARSGLIRREEVNEEFEWLTLRAREISEIGMARFIGYANIVFRATRLCEV